MTNERVRELCARVLAAEGPAFEAALRDLFEALDQLREQNEDDIDQAHSA
jgi:hypothetical protein